MKLFFIAILLFSFSLSAWPQIQVKPDQIPRDLPLVTGRGLKELDTLSHSLEKNFQLLDKLRCALPLSPEKTPLTLEKEAYSKVFFLYFYSYFWMTMAQKIILKNNALPISATFEKTNLYLKENPHLIEEVARLVQTTSWDQMTVTLKKISDPLIKDTSEENIYFRNFWLSAAIASESIDSYFSNYKKHMAVNALCGASFVEVASFFSYSGLGYIFLAKESLFLPKIKSSLSLVKKSLVSFLKRVSIFSDEPIYIGTYLNPAEWTSILNEGRISYSSFVSGSINTSFSSFNKNTVLKVLKNKSGALVAPVSLLRHEGEVLWHKPKFKILKAELDDGKTLWLDVEEI